jgi:hypothetical protein
MGIVLLLSGGAARASLTITSGSNTMTGDGTLTLTNFALEDVHGSVTGSFTGTVTEILKKSKDEIQYSGTFAGSGTFEITNTYSFGSAKYTTPLHGWLISSFSGQLFNSTGNPNLDGSEFWQATASATTFLGTQPVIAEFDYSGSNVVGQPINGQVFSADTSEEGFYNQGPGTLTGIISYNAGAGRSFVMSGDITAYLPEPSTLTLALIGGAAMWTFLWRRRVAEVAAS